MFFTHAITILSLFTYFVCDEKVKIKKWRPDFRNRLMRNAFLKKFYKVTNCIIYRIFIFIVLYFMIKD